MNGASTEVFRSSSQPVSSGSSAGRGNGGEDQLAPTNRLSPQFSISASDESSEIELFTTSSKRRRTDASDEEKIELSEDDPESNKDLSGGSNFAGVERISADREAAPSPVASSMEAAATAPAGAITPQDSQFRLSPRKHRPPALPSKARGTGDDPIPIDGTNDTRYESDETKDTLLEFGSPVFAPYPGKDPVNEGEFDEQRISCDGRSLIFCKCIINRVLLGKGDQKMAQTRSPAILV